jgi:hypothetical protein
VWQAGQLSKMVNELAAGFDFLHPEKSVKGLVNLYNSLKALPDGYWKNKKMDEVKELVLQCSGLWLDVFTSEQFAVQTDSIRFNFQFNNRLGANAAINKISVDGFDSSFNQQLARNRNINFAKTFFVPAAKAVTQPYWLREKMELGYFNVKDQLKIGIPDAEPSYVVSFVINVEGTEITVSRPVKYKFTDPVRGEIYYPLVVIPPVLITPSEDLKIVLNDAESSKGTISLKGTKKGFSGKPVAKTAGSWKAVPGFSFGNKEIAFTSKNQVTDMSYTFKSQKRSEKVVMGVFDSLTQTTYTDDKHEIKYDHIPAINYFHGAEVAFNYTDMKTHGKKIGYIVGAGDKVPEALEQMGFEVTLLGNKELAKNNLQQFDAIITGVRTYNTNDWMNNHYDKLMKYVENGGNMIVQYNTNSFIGGIRSKMGPYPFVINRNRITDENAAVTFLNPEHPVFNYPNKITENDFKDWIQERSIYHATDSSGKFEKLIAMNDPGEKADDGSLLVAKYGKGYFTYTGLVFFRELPAGVPGAYRLLANLIALNRKKAF